jgi:hypothetical protein
MTQVWRGRALQGAYNKGVQAAKNGKKITDCPYRDKRGGQYDQIITWSRSFRNAWKEGFNEAIKRS